jgi:putative transposase
VHNPQPSPEDWRTNRRWEKRGEARLLTFSCEKRLPLFGRDNIRDAFVQTLGTIRDKHRFRLLAYVVMPDHVHLIVLPRPVVAVEAGRVFTSSASTVEDILWGLKKPFSQRVLSRWRTLNAPILSRLLQTDGTHRFWLAGGGHDHNLVSEEALWDAIRYVKLNPVRRELVQRAIDWPWSSARWYDGQTDVTLSIDLPHDGRRWTPPEHWIAEAIDITDDLVRRPIGPS